MGQFKIESGDRITTKFSGRKWWGTVYTVEQFCEEPAKCDVCVGSDKLGGDLIIENVPVTDVKQTPGTILRRGILSVIKELA
jgi:hypothetical protein